MGMRLSKSLCLLTLLAASPMPLSALYKTYCFPNVELSAEALYVERKGIRKENLIKPIRCPCRSSLTTATCVRGFDWEPGVRGFVRIMPSNERTIELSVSWVNEFKSTVTREAPYITDSTAVVPAFSYPFDYPTYALDFTNAQKVTAHYTSQLWDAEANYWGHLTPRNVNYFAFSALIGLRGMYLSEHFRLAYTKTPDTSTYRARTINKLIGVQVGGDLQWNPVRVWSFDLMAKTGLLADFAHQHLHLGDLNDTVVLKNFSNHRVFPSVLLEGGLFLYYRPRPRFSLHAGYRLLGVWDLALAPMQLTGKTGPRSGHKVDSSGHIYLHIVSLGLDIAF